MAELVEVEEPVPSILLPCATCNRTFRPEALVKHAKVCEKSLMKKRKKFDSAQQRIQGTELAQFSPIPGKSSKKKEQSPIKKESRWKEKHIELVESIRAARNPNHHPRSNSKPPGHEQCPHCDRFFGPKAFDRHAEWCKEQQTRVRAKSQACLQAKERLQARTKYRAPLNKTQRAVTKEKYSPVRPQRDPSPLVVQPSSTLTKTSSSGSMNFSRSTSQRSGLQHNSQISSNIQQRAPLRNESPRRQQLEKDNKKKPEERDTSRIRSMSTQPKMPSKPVLERKRDLEKYDPYASAELQMMELFSGDNNEVNNDNESKDKPLSVESHPATPEEEEVERPSPEGSVATECLAEDNTNNNAETRRNLSLSSLSLCSVVSLDSVDCNRNPGLGRRSSSAQARPPPRLVDMHQMLYGSVNPQEADDLEACEAQLLVSMLEFEKMLKRSPTPPDPHPQSSPNLCSSTFGPSDNYRSRIISTPSDTSSNQKPVHQSFDSAYSSLTRKTPTDGLEMNKGDFSQASKFCHECGCKYPLAAAKFCCQCGIRRLAI